MRIVNNNNDKLRILIAEDDGFQRASLVDLLEMCNYEGLSHTPLK